MHPPVRLCCQLSGICLVFVLNVLGVTPVATPAQKGKHPIVFAGRVESIDYKMNTVAVQHGPIPGYMPAMTMDYPVENAAVLRQLKPSDEIAATVFVGDPVLHDLHIMKQAKISGAQGNTDPSGPSVRPNGPVGAKPGN
jgi:Cu/Ag efflux protein CusF